MRLKQLKEEIVDLRQKLDELGEQERALEFPMELSRKKRKVGACYKFRNSYAGPPCWWLYRKVLDVTSEGYFITEEFQDDGNGRLEFIMSTDPFITSGFGRISGGEYGRAKRHHLKKMGLWTKK